MTQSPQVQSPAPAAPGRIGRAATTGRTIAQAAVGDKVRAGRLRNVDWPYGLEAVVALVLVLACVSAVIALLSGPLRRGSLLLIATEGGSSTPVGLVWLIAFLVVVALSLFTLAAMHGPWWLKTLGFFVGSILLAVWGVTGGGGAGLPALPAAAAILGLVAFWIVRGRKAFAWWEFPLLLGLYGLPVGAVIAAMSANAENFGFEFAPLLVEQTASILGFLVLPAALVAGAAVAELTVAATVAATRHAQRLARIRWVYGALAVLVVLRGVQVGFQLADLDPVEEGWLALGPAVGLAIAFGLVSWLMVRMNRRRHDELPVSELPDDLARVGVPVGVAMVCVLLPVFAFLFAYQALYGLFPDVARSIDFDPSPVVDRITDGFRGLLGLILILIGTRLARRGRPGAAVILGCVGVMLLALAMRLITGYRWALWIDPDSLNLVATATVIVVAVWHVVRRSLTRERAVAIGALLVLSALFSYRDFVSDPIGVLIGYSGVALVLFGLVWDFLTGSDWANGDSRRFPRPVRVLLAVTYTLLTVTILAYTSLIRDSRGSVGLDEYAELGDLVLGTALLAAAFTAVLRTVRHERPVA